MADIMVTLQKLANENTAKTFKFNKEEAATSRKWQEQMSNTSHQREVKDLIAAGLNPVLSSGGQGAQSYSTQSASGVADSAVNAIGSVQSSRTSAAATRYAANQSLKASQAIANAQAYAAQMQYAAQKYAADRKSVDNFISNRAQWQRTKLQSDTDKWIAQNKQANNGFALADKYLGQGTKAKYDAWISSKNYTDMFTHQSKVALTPSNVKRITGSVTKKYYNSIASALNKNGYVVSDWNIAAIINAFATGRKLDTTKLIKKYDHSHSASALVRFM